MWYDLQSTERQMEKEAGLEFRSLLARPLRRRALSDFLR
jgi:hypothetical protein